MSRFSLKSLGLALLAAAVTFTFTPNVAVAQSSDASIVVTVPATDAPVLITQKVDMSKTFRLSNAMPDMKGASDLGPAPADMKLGLQLELRRSATQRQELNKFNLAAITPGDESFGKTVTPADFAAKFGLAQADLDTLTGVLKDAGFTVGNVDNGRLVITFEGTVKQVNEALQTSIHLYQDSNGANRYAPATAPLLPRALAPVVGAITGLDNFRPLVQKGFDGPVTDFKKASAKDLSAAGNAPAKIIKAGLEGEMLHDASFTASNAATLFSQHTPTQLNVRIGGNNFVATGKLQIVDDKGASIAYVADITTCPAYNNGYGRSCTFSYTPKAVGLAHLTAIYSGNSNERGLVQRLVHPDVGTNPTIVTGSSTPVGVFTSAATSVVYTVTVSWTTPGAIPTGTIEIFDATEGTSHFFGSATLPTTIGANTSGSSPTTPTHGTATYACTAYTWYTSCAITTSDSNAAFEYAEDETYEVEYVGDTNYAVSTLVQDIYYGDNSSTETPVVTPTIAASGSLTAATYGTAQAESNTLTLTGAGTEAFGLEGSLIFTQGGANIGELNVSDASCSSATSCTFTNTFTIPGVAAPGTYTLTYAYSGNALEAKYYGVATTTGAATLTVNQQTPNFGPATASPASVITGSSTAVTLGANLAYTGVGAVPATTGSSIPTITMNSVTYNLTCTGTSSPLSCTVSVPGATIAALASGAYAITASYPGDINYTTTTATAGSLIVGSDSVTLTATPATTVYGSATTVALLGTVTVANGGPTPTGTVTFTNNSGVTAIGSVNLTSCTPTVGASTTAYACSYTWTPPYTVSGDNAGAYTVSGAYSGDSNYSAATPTASFVITKATTTVTATNPIIVTSGNSGDAIFTVTVTYTGTGIPPTGNVTLTNGANIFSEALMPVAGSTTSSGSITPPTGYVNNYTCQDNAPTTLTVTCNITTVDLYAAVTSGDSYTFVANYNGDTNYGTSTYSDTLTASKNDALATNTVAASPTSVVYGSGASSTYTTTLIGTNAHGTLEAGQYQLSGTPITGSPVTVTINSSGSTPCTLTATYSVACAEAIVVPATTAAGAYTVTSLFLGTANYAAASATTTLTVNKATTTAAMTSPTAASPVTQSFGALTAFTVQGTLTWTGTGAAPTAADVTFTSTAGTAGTATCTPTGTVYACSALFTPTAGDAIGSYNINLSFSGDTNYSSSVSTVVANYIVAGNDTSMLTASPSTQPYGDITPVVLTDTLTFQAGITPVSTDTITFTNSTGVTAIGSMMISACSSAGQVYTCAFNWTVPDGASGDNVGSYTVTSAFSGDGTANMVSTTTAFAITQQTPTFGTMTFSPAASEPYGTAQIITISDTLNFTGGGLAPTGAVKYVLNGVTYTATCTGSTSPLTCTYAVPAATIAALAAGSYPVTASYTADTNYAAATGASGTFTITTGMFSTIQMTTSTYTTPPTPTTQGYGSVTPFSVYATLSPAGSIAPTGADMTFTTSTAGIGTFGTATCTVASGVAECTATFTPNGTAMPASYNINVSFSGDANYGAAGPSTNGTGLYVVTDASPTLTFSPSPITSIFGSTNPIGVTVTASNGDTGTVNFTGSYATYGTLSATSCTITATSCSVTFTPNGTTAIGTYSNILTADLPANGDFNDATANDSLTISKQTTNLAMTTTPVAYFDAAGTGTFVTVISWTNPLLEPTGTIAITDTTATARAIGTITLSPTGAAIASGTACTTAGAEGTCTYSCAAVSDLAVSCTVTNTKASGTDTATTSVADVADGNTMLATYSGDSNFASATNNAYLYNQYEYAADGGAATIALSGTAIANATYGLTTAESPTVKITDSDDDPPTDSTGIFLDITSTGATGTMYENALTTCTASPCTVVTSWTFPAVVAPGTYALSYNYSGNYQSASGDTDQTTLASGSVVVSKQTPTMGTVSFSPAASEPYGTNQAITISDTLTYLGVGEAPQGAVNFNLNSTNYLATCTLTSVSGSGNSQSNVETCSATVLGTVIDALAVNTYTVTAAYTTDTNYAAATGTSATFTISQQTPTFAITNVSPASEVFGAGTPVTVTSTLTYTGSGAAPTGTPVFSQPALGTYGTVSCGSPSGDIITCTVSFTPSGNDAAGTYTLDGTYPGNTNYAASTSAQTNNFTITGATTTLALTGATNGTTTAGVTTDTLTATSNLLVAGIPVVFTDTTTSTVLGTANTLASGVATLTVTTATAGVSAGKDVITASIASTSNYSAASSSALTIYLQGILFANFNTHNFSGLTTDGAIQVEGTVDGTTGAAYGVAVVNFTSSVQTLPATLTNDATADFTISNTCGGSVAAGAVCELTFNYAPVYPTGCDPNLAPPPAGTGCTLDGSGYPQGTFESATWSYTLPGGVIAGLGNLGFTTSGKASSGATIEGKAIQAAGTLTVTPTTAAFGTIAQNSASNTITVTVTNSNSGAIAFSYTGPTTPHFTTANNTCTSPLGANSSCNIYLTAATGTTGSFTDSVVITPTGGTASTVALSSTVDASSTGLTISSTEHNFGNVTDGTSTAFSATITNNTGVSATVSFSNVAGGGFSTSTTCGGMIAAGASCVYGFTFAPTTTGSASDVLTITSSVPVLPGGTGSGPYMDTITVTGTGVTGGKFTATSATHNWGTLAVGTSGGNYGVELTNNTGASITLSTGPLSSGATAAGFTLVGSTCTGPSLANNSNCEMVFNFTPTGTGAVSASYPITSNATLYVGVNPVSPSQITLKGTGQ